MEYKAQLNFPKLPSEIGYDFFTQIDLNSYEKWKYFHLKK